MGKTLHEGTIGQETAIFDFIDGICRTTASHCGPRQGGTQPGTVLLGAYMELCISQAVSMPTLLKE